MSDVAHRFFDRIWSRGETQLIDELLAENFAYKDMIWAAKRPIVGLKAFKAYVEGMRTAYPDLYYEITSVGVSDPSHVFVHWDCHGTNLQPTVDEHGKPHKPTFHESHISGIDIITFTEDRSKIQEVVIYRQPTLEEREFLEEEALEQDRLTIRLERLHFDRGSPK